MNTPSPQKTALLVFGMHRSGTSALTRTANLLGGVLPDRLMKAAEGNNAQGFWEPQDVYEHNEQLLQTLDSQWDDWRPLPPPSLRTKAAETTAAVRRRILRENYADATFMVLKDPRMCRLFPYWCDAFAQAGFQPRALLALRDPLEVADSLRARDAFSTNRSLLLWLRHMLDAERHSRSMPRSVIAFPELLRDWRAQMTRAEQQLQIHWPRPPDSIAAEVDSFLDAGNRHHQHDPAKLAADPDVFAWVRGAYAAFEQLITEPQSSAAEQQLDQIRQEFDDACEIFGPEWFAAEKQSKQSRQALEVAEYQKQKLDEKATGLGERLERSSQALLKDRETIQYLNTALDQEKHRKQHAEERLTQAQGALDATRERLEKTNSDLSRTRSGLQQTRTQLVESRKQLGEYRKRSKIQQAQLESNRAAFDQQERRSARYATQFLASIAVVAAQTGGQRPLSAALKTRLYAARRSTPSQQTLAHLVDTGLFDAAYYRTANPDVASSDVDPLLHWLREGWQQGRRPSLWFDSQYYLSHNTDVAESGVNPLLHYLESGWKEHRRPHPLFDPDWYLQQAPDLDPTTQEPLSHYAQTGHREHRPASIWLDSHWYAQHHGITVDKAFAHYSLLAASWPASPTPYFDALWYLQQNPDVAASSTPPFAHFLEAGAAEGRDPNPWFDSAWYRNRFPDCGPNPLLHYLLREDRPTVDPGPNFSVSAYRERYPDVARTNTDTYRHFLSCGREEGRNPAPAPRPQPSVPPRKRGTPHSRAPIDEELTEARIRSAVEIAESQAVARRFSIILPTWNRRETIIRAIDSVMQQSYPHWELIICDDGSDDDTATVVHERFADEIAAQRIRYLSLPHAGVSAARNAGLAQARGDWIAYLDSDNSWRPHYLLISAQALLQPGCRTHYAGLQVHNAARHQKFVRCVSFNWQELLRQNFIDLNIFVHDRGVYEQLGGFDEQLKRLVDWDLILRYTQLYPATLSPFILAEYYLAESLHNITNCQPLAPNEIAVRRKYASHSVPDEGNLRLAYVLWDWPALSQTFVMEELRELVQRGIDVRVYYHSTPDRAAEQLPPVEATAVTSVDDLCSQLLSDDRNWMHTHFAYPALTRLIWPAAEKCAVPFSFMPHAVDIFHYDNRQRNQIAEVTASPYWARTMIYGEHHRAFLLSQGVPDGKFSFTHQAVDLEPFYQPIAERRQRQAGEPLRILCIARLIEKKGLSYLIDAMAQNAADGNTACTLKLYGYGPLQDALQTQVRERGLESAIEFCGGYEGVDAIREALQWADIFCLPCVEAENGDVDGMPTVFIEAAAAGLPVLSTTVSAIPDFITHGVDGFLVPPRDSEALARHLKLLAQAPREQLQQVAISAQNKVRAHFGATKTIDTLLDVACRPPLDIFMVTFHREGYGNWPATERAIRGVLEKTTTPFRLTIVDNASSADFVQQLQELAREDTRIRLILLPENIYCGPASNMAIALAESEFAIYVCSNEGYIVRRGWERPLLQAMRNAPDAALGGHLAYSPRWHDGQSYAAQPWFASFRKPEFARNNPQRPFRHIQGGLFILRTAVVQDAGGFSPDRPQDLMDVELSYYLESLGHHLLEIPEIVALSNKTRPQIDALVDERTVAVHPVFPETLPLMQALERGEGARCNLCGWIGDSERADDMISFTCPECGSSGADRGHFRELAQSDLHHRNLSLSSAGLGAQARERLQSMFTLVDNGQQPGLIPLPPSRTASRMLGIGPTAVKTPRPSSG